MEYIKILAKDKILKKLLIKHGPILRAEVTQDLFTDLVSSIVSQQLSTKAAATIWGRFEAIFSQKKVTPRKLLKVSNDIIRESGVSYSKIKYMKGLAELIVKKQLDLSKVYELPDEDVIVELTKVKGVGRWTAEMILMFSLSREDVFSLGDLGLRNAVAKLYGINRDDLKKIEKLSFKWKPYRTYASMYLWKSLDNKPITVS